MTQENIEFTGPEDQCKYVVRAMKWLETKSLESKHTTIVNINAGNIKFDERAYTRDIYKICATKDGSIPICIGCRRNVSKAPLPTCPMGHHNSYRTKIARRWERLKLRALQTVGHGTVKCRCGLTDIRVLSINHKNGGGTQDRKKYNGGTRLYYAIVTGKRSIEDLEILCANCQILYEYEVGRRTKHPGWENPLAENIRGE